MLGYTPKNLNIEESLLSEKLTSTNKTQSRRKTFQSRKRNLTTIQKLLKEMNFKSKDENAKQPTFHDMMEAISRSKGTENDERVKQEVYQKV